MLFGHIFKKHITEQNILKKLHKYILKAFLGPWLITFFVCVFILLMQFLWRYIDDLVGKGLEWNIIFELMFYASFSLVPLALPLAGLLASIMTMGKFGETNELFAMKSGGVSLYRIMFPLIVLNLIISAIAFGFSNNLMPYTNLKMKSLLYNIQQQRPEINIQNGIFSEPVDDIALKVDSKNKDNTLNELLIYDHRQNANPNNVTIAEQGSILITEDKSVMILELFNGTRHEDIGGKSYRHQSTRFDKQITYVELDNVGIDSNNEDFFKNGYDMQNNNQLHYTIDSLNNSISNREEEICENFKRFSMFKGMNAIYGTKQEDNSWLKTKPLNVEGNNDEEIIRQLCVDSLYSRMSPKQKTNVLEFALTYSRSADSYIEVVNAEIIGTRRWICRHEMEWYRKYALSIACLLFCMVGVPLGSVIRKGGYGLSLVISVLIFLMYYILSTIVENTVKELVTPAIIGMWVSTAILLPIGIYLIIAVANDNLRISNQRMQKIIDFFKLKWRKKKSKES